MVNAEDGDIPRDEESPSLPTISVGNSNSLDSCDITNGINSHESPESAPSPPSPVGSESWQCPNSAAMMLQAEELLSSGCSLQAVLRTICPQLQEPPGGWSDERVMSILSDILDQPPSRQKLAQYNTFEDAIELFRTRRRILILTGAGVSVSCGIPDFRSKDGVYARLHVDFPDLPDPTAMFDIRYFEHNPAPFYDFAQEIFPGQFEPSVSHKFIRELEKSDKLLRNYTQNIDTLEKQTGIERVIECHGSFSKATCRNCKAKFAGDIIREDVMAKRVAKCRVCGDGVIKPDIVFFGEDLSEDFHRQMSIDKDHVDLLVVIGSSLKVRPVSLIPFSVADDVPQILINREPLSNYTADIELLGNCDDVIRDICLALGGDFEEMLDSHDTRMASLKPEAAKPNRKRRHAVEQAEFEKIMQGTADDESPEEDKKEDSPENEDDDGEPEAKRLCLAGMYQPRFVSVESKLPEHSYFKVSPNKSIFPGAEIYYDLESKMITRPVLYRSRNGYASESSEDGSDDDDTSISFRGGSEPPDLNRGRSSSESSRAASCEPSVDVDSFISTLEFRRTLDETMERIELD